MAGLHGPCHHEPPRSPGRAPCFLSIRLEPFRQPRRLVLAQRIAARAGCVGAAAGAGMRDFLGLIGVALAETAGAYSSSSCTHAGVE